MAGFAEHFEGIALKWRRGTGHLPSALPGVRDMPSVLTTAYTEHESDKKSFKNKHLSRYDVAGLLNM
jgi:hypothetical protein